jgi:hypothetical protein
VSESAYAVTQLGHWHVELHGALGPRSGTQWLVPSQYAEALQAVEHAPLQVLVQALCPLHT